LRGWLKGKARSDGWPTFVLSNGCNIYVTFNHE
jgi:hypothetical protein